MSRVLVITYQLVIFIIRYRTRVLCVNFFHNIFKDIIEGVKCMVNKGIAFIKGQNNFISD